MRLERNFDEKNRNPAPYIDQTERWVNGCESISSVMLLQAMGIAITRTRSLSRTCPTRPTGIMMENSTARIPMKFFPGDPHDHTGYGCYAPCIVKALQSALDHEGAADAFEVVDETGKTAAQLCEYH